MLLLLGKFLNSLHKEKEEEIPDNIISSVEFGYGSKMGYGPKKTECQDSFCFMERFQIDCNCISIFDGHGENGKEASQAVNDYFQTYLERNGSLIIRLPNDKLRQVFFKEAYKFVEKKILDSGIDFSNSGTCALSVLLYKSTCYTINIGDSRAVLFRQNGQEAIAIDLSSDHRTIRQDERERILKNGGKIKQNIVDGNTIGLERIWANEQGPGFATTRSLGDFESKKFGIDSNPDINIHQLTPEDKFIVIGTDGVWDVLSSNEVIAIIQKNLESSIEDIASAIISESRRRWEESCQAGKELSKVGDNPTVGPFCDDISCIVMKLHYYND